MKQKLTWLVLGISLLANLFFGVKIFQTRETNTATVARVVDGDTFNTATNVPSNYGESTPRNIRKAVYPSAPKTGWKSWF